MLQAGDIYRYLMTAGERPLCEAFDAHLIAASFSVGMGEVEKQVPLPESLGLSLEEIRELVLPNFPHAEPLLEGAVEVPDLSIPEHELQLRDLLYRGSTNRTTLERRLAAVVARRAQYPNHLWQDLGLRHRRELSWLMTAHFEPIANRNVGDMKWKKFLYRAICRDTGNTLCVAPSCGECDEYDVCFGDESGESLLNTSPPTESVGANDREPVDGLADDNEQLSPSEST